MKIDLDSLEYKFLHKPLLIGGKAMEYYDLRQAGADIDFVVRNNDHAYLVAKYPGHVRDVCGDVGVCVHGFELWNRILLFPYEFLSSAAREEDNFLVVSLERLLFLKTQAISVEKNERDVRLIDVDEDVRKRVRSGPWRFRSRSLCPNTRAEENSRSRRGRPRRSG